MCRFCMLLLTLPCHRRRCRTQQQCSPRCNASDSMSTDATNLDVCMGLALMVRWKKQALPDGVELNSPSRIAHSTSSRSLAHSGPLARRRSAFSWSANFGAAGHSAQLAKAGAAPSSLHTATLPKLAIWSAHQPAKQARPGSPRVDTGWGARHSSCRNRLLNCCRNSRCHEFECLGRGHVHLNWRDDCV